FAHGGGIQTQLSSLSIINSTIANNYAAEYGAGISTQASKQLTITNSTIANNRITDNITPFDVGAAIDNIGPLILESCTLSGNLVFVNTQTADLNQTAGTATLHNTILNG